jgi:hypothetical protein
LQPIAFIIYCVPYNPEFLFSLVYALCAQKDNGIIKYNASGVKSLCLISSFLVEALMRQINAFLIPAIDQSSYGTGNNDPLHQFDLER